jgi:2-dehydro-3-deoxyphosphogluconate aldolase/(4S)-4-hydroxy-2-oxoglutarate aldolase
MIPKGLIAVIRTSSTDACRVAVQGLIEAKVRAIEITMTVPGALEIIAEFANGPSVIGVGTVVDRNVCADAIAAGATFVVSPVTDHDVFEVAQSAGVPYIPGALTPIEVMAALRLGIETIKIFPAGSLGGASYVKTLRDPFPSLRAVVSGGVEVREFGDYLRAGVHAICLGGSLIDHHAALAGDVNAVAAHASAVLAEFDAVQRSLSA